MSATIANQKTLADKINEAMLEAMRGGVPLISIQNVLLHQVRTIDLVAPMIQAIQKHREGAGK